ncbi:hypothetical protein [Devosia sp.]|uniref:hypothetical protein n=1 Tax=Devosia sp. TaxID=1871048 RepID=UPI001AFF76A6|nr:hypothetical protein [Devosia sp.]MBO9588551.1 hypothetical protein [Devosia sp.]
MSRLDLALTARISQRHLGFVELGRSRASQKLLARLLDALDAAPSERAMAFLHAGFVVPDATQNQDRRRQSQALISLTRQ